MPNRSIFLAGAAGLALLAAPVASQAQQSWGNSTTTYWGHPETGSPAAGKDFSNAGTRPSAAPPTDSMQYQPTGTERMQPGIRKPMAAKKQTVRPKMKQGEPATMKQGQPPQGDMPGKEEGPKSGMPAPPPATDTK